MGIGIRVVVAFSVLAGGCLARLAVGGFSLAPTHMTLAAAHTGIYRGKRTSTRMSRLCAKSGALEVTDANFALEVLNHSKHIPVLVFFRYNEVYTCWTPAGCTRACTSTCAASYMREGVLVSHMC
jgi:hypothetical protein